MPTTIFNIPVWLILLALIPVLLISVSGLLRSGSPVPFLSRKRRPTALYIFRGSRDNTLVKVGYTSRRFEARQTELQRDCGQPLELILLVRMPHAWYAEQRLHSWLSRKGWRLPRSAGLGAEWYRIPVRKQRGLIGMAQAAADATRRQARRRFSWKKSDEVKAWILTSKGARQSRLARL